jgi:hypothetical protein
MSKGARSGPFVMDGPLAWSFPAAILLFATTLVAYVVALLFAISGSPLPATIDGRLVACFAGAAGAAGVCLPISAVHSRGGRILASAICGAAAAAVLWVAVLAITG